MPETPQAERPTPETDENEVYYNDECLEGCRVVTSTFARTLERQRDALAERVKEAERGEIAWQDGNIPELIHSATVEQTRSIMKAYFDEWPDGLDEIESSINQFKQRAELAESRLASLTEELKRLTGLNWPDSKQVATVTLPSGDKWATCPAIAEHIASLTEAAKRLVEAWRADMADYLTVALVEQGDAACAEIDAARGGEGK